MTKWLDLGIINLWFIHFSLFLVNYMHTHEAKNEQARSYIYWISTLQLKPYLTSIAGSLPPACRRSLFTLATSMILFSSKAYNILPLVYRAKTALTDKMVGMSHCWWSCNHWLTLLFIYLAIAGLKVPIFFARTRYI